jgi:hypothetical protein
MKGEVAMRGLSNVKTLVSRRVDGDTNIRKKQMDKLVKMAKQNIPYNRLHTWNASINGVIIQLVTNSDHLIDFWIENWFPAPLEGTEPHGIIYAVIGVEGEKSYAYYCSESKTAVFVNTDYYGQCKSWALGMVADIMEMQRNIHSIHAAVVDIGGCGIAIIAPTGTGKSTHSYGLMLTVPNARIHSDDWCYVDYIGGTLHGRASATISERKFYLRTDIVQSFPNLAELLDHCKLENVGDDYASVANSRAIVDPKWIGGLDKFIYTTRIRSVILLTRDDYALPERKLEPDEAIEILKKGDFMVLPGGGTKEEWGKKKSEPFYNPYLLVRNEERTALQTEFFQKLFNFATCHILNTGRESVEETRARILRIAEEATRLKE